MTLACSFRSSDSSCGLSQKVSLNHNSFSICRWNLEATVLFLFVDVLRKFVATWQSLISFFCQAARLREDIHNMGSLYMSEICTEMKNLRSLVRVCEVQATLREQRWGKCCTCYVYTEMHLNWWRHSPHAFMYFISPLKLQNPVSEAAEQRVRQVEEPEFLHGVRSWPEKKWLERMD